MALALRYERRLAHRGGSPLMDLSLFASRAFSAGLGIAVAFMAFFVSSIFVMSLLLQSGLGLTPLQGGLSFGPFCIAQWSPPSLAGGSSPATGRAGHTGWLRHQRYRRHPARRRSRSSGREHRVGWLVVGLGIVGAGNSLLLTAYLGATLSAVRPDQAGIASGTLNTIQQFAGSTGLAVIGAVFFAILGDHSGPGHYAHAAATVFWIGLGLVVIMAALTALLPREAAPPDPPEPVVDSSRSLWRRRTPTPPPNARR